MTLLLKTRYCLTCLFRKNPFRNGNNTKALSSAILDPNKKEGKILRGPFPDVEIPNISIPDCVFQNIHKWGKNIAVECAVTGRKYTYDQMAFKSDEFNKALRKIFGLERNDVVAVLLPNIPEYTIVVFGVLKAGLTLTTINPNYTEHEICHQLKDSGADVLITLPSLFERAEKAKKLAEKNLPVIVIKDQANEEIPRGAIDFNELLSHHLDLPEVPPWPPAEIAFLPYSSGTTGLPKAVELTHFNAVANILEVHPELTGLREATSQFQEVVPIIIPMFHIYGLMIPFLECAKIGAKLVTIPRFTPEWCVDLFDKYRPSALFAAPPLILFLTNHEKVHQEFLEKLHVTFSGAAPLGGTDELKFQEKTRGKCHILQGYGLTETSSVATVLSQHAKDIYRDTLGSVGHPLPNVRVKIISTENPSDSTPLPPNTSGEILIKGPNVMKGYRNNPKQNEEVFLDGWLRTGDIGHYNNEGIIYITDRLKELIKVRGFQVAPAELEAILRSFEGVSEAAVIGIPHDKHGELPRAYVVGKKNVDLSQLKKYVEEKVAKHKKLDGGLVMVEDIPKNPSGKILRRKLKEIYLNGDEKVVKS